MAHNFITKEITPM